MGNREKAVYLVLKALGVGVDRLRGFDGRRMLQKAIYLLQDGPHRWDFGFHYNLYLRGPYSPSLADTGYQLLENFAAEEPKLAALSLKDECIWDIGRIRAAFESRQGELDPDLLEVAATIRFLCGHTYSYLPAEADRVEHARDWIRKNKPLIADHLETALSKLKELEIAV